MTEIRYPPGTEVRDTPDPPPVETWMGTFWWFANRNAELAFRFARLCGFLVLVLLVTPVHSQESTQGTGIVCDEAVQLEMFMAFNRDFPAIEAIKQVNIQVGNDNACGIATVQYFLGEEIKRVGSFRIVKILVIAANVDRVWHTAMKPEIQFTIFFIEGKDA